MGLQFRLLGIPVRVHPLFLVTAVLLWYLGPERTFSALFIWVAVVFTGVLLHEYGHALAGRAFGLVPRIELYAMGGLTWWEQGRKLSPARGIVTSVAGPLVGIVLGTAAYVVSELWPPQTRLGGFTFFSLVWVNLGWGVLNLIPMLPLDGGNIMASVFELFSKRRARQAARYVSIAIALVFAIWALASEWIIAALLVGMLGWNNVRALRDEKELERDMPLREELQAAYAALATADARALQEHAEQLMRSAQTHGLRAEAQLLSAWARLLRGDAAAARAALDALPAGGMTDPILEGALLLDDDDIEGAARHFEHAFGSERTPVPELRMAAAFAATGRFDVAHYVFESKAARRASPEMIQQVEHAAYRAGAFEQAAKLGEALFERLEHPMAAYNAACSWARAGDPKQAMRWLERARDAGFERTELLDEDDDLAPVRSLADWQSLRRSFDQR